MRRYTTESFLTQEGHTHTCIDRFLTPAIRSPFHHLSWCYCHHLCSSIPSTTAINPPRWEHHDAPHRLHIIVVTPACQSELVRAAAVAWGMEAEIPVPPPSLGERRTRTHCGSQTPEPELTSPTSVLYHFSEDNHSVAGAAAASPGATAAVYLGAMASPTPFFVEWGRETEWCCVAYCAASPVWTNPKVIFFTCTYLIW
jgi:hypothetical protein